MAWGKPKWAKPKSKPRARPNTRGKSGKQVLKAKPYVGGSTKPRSNPMDQRRASRPAPSRADVKARKKVVAKRKPAKPGHGIQVGTGAQTHDIKRYRSLRRQAIGQLERDLAESRRRPASMLDEIEEPTKKERHRDRDVEHHVKRLFDQKRSRGARTASAIALKQMGVVDFEPVLRRIGKEDGKDVYERVDPVSGTKTDALTRKRIDGRQYVKAGKGYKLKPVKKDSFLEKAADFVLDQGDKRSGFKGEQNETIKALASIKPKKLLSNNPSSFKSAGPAAAGKAAAAAGKLALNTGIAFVDRPDKVLLNSAKSLPGIAVGMIPGAAVAVSDPAKALKAVKADYKRRFSGSSKSQRERIKNEGAVAEVLDAAGVGAVAGRAATVGRRLKDPSYGRRARPEIMTGVKSSRHQRTAAQQNTVAEAMRLPPNALKIEMQKAIDKQRTASMVRREKRGSIRPDQREALTTGRVAPLTRAGRDRLVKRVESQDNTTNRAQGRELKKIVTQTARKFRKELTREQLHKGALRFAVEYGWRSPDHVRRHAPTLMTRIENARKEGNDREAEHPFDDIKTLAYLNKNADKLFDAKLAKAADHAQALAAHAGALDPTLVGNQPLIRAQRAQAKMLGVERGDANAPVTASGVPAMKHVDESIEQWLDRAERARYDEGLAPGGYFHHSEESLGKVGNFLRGSGRYAPREHMRSRDVLSDLGRVNPSADVGLYPALGRNMRNRTLQSFVSNFIDKHAVDHLYNAKTGERIDVKDLDSSQMKKAMRLANVTEKDLTVVNFGKLKAAVDEVDNLDAQAADGDVGALLKEQIADSQITLKALADMSPEDRQGYQFVDTAAFDELTNEAARQGKAGRRMRKYGKSLPSRIMLGTSPTWAGIQLINMGTLAALGGVAPASVRGSKFFRDNPDLKQQYDARGGSGAFETERHVGRVSGHPSNKAAAHWQDIKDELTYAKDQVPGLRNIDNANPLDVLFKYVDAPANTVIREAAEFGQLKRLQRNMSQEVKIAKRNPEAYEGMRFASAELVGGMDEASRILALPDPQARLRAIAEKPEVLEHVGQAVDEIHGNYTRYTSNERRLLEQNIMFYGFLRFSMRFALYTLPFKHPLVTNLSNHLANLQKDEARRMLGLSKEDNVPLDMLSKFYSLDKDGHLMSVGMNRLSPVLNAVTQAKGPHQILAGMASPLIAETINQVFSINLYKGQHWTVDGKTQDVGVAAFGDADVNKARPEILLGNLARLAAPVRTHEQVLAGPDPQGADSNFITGMEPKLPKDEDYLTSIELARDRQEPAWKTYLRGSANPFIARPSVDDEVTFRRGVTKLREGDEADKLIAGTREAKHLAELVREYSKGRQYGKANARAIRKKVKRDVADTKKGAKNLKKKLREEALR